MITESDIDAAIAECVGERNPNANTCIKLAAFYTIKQHLFRDAEPVRISDQRAETAPSNYSFSPAPDQKPIETVTIDSDTEFARVIEGREQKEIWPVLDELMSILHDMIPRLYTDVMRRLQ